LFKRRLEKTLVKRAIRRFRNDLKIIIGSAATKQESWISTDYPLLDLTDEATFLALFPVGSVNNFFAEHVWEHLSPKEGAKACQNCFAYLKRGGVLRLAVPDGLHPDPSYIEYVRPGGSGPGSDDHKVLYNYETLSCLLLSAGFKIRLLEWFDEHGNFHHEEWDVRDGFVVRSTRFDQRNKINKTAYTSLIIDAQKP
jgi:predicted SAM-dependent methyltransferase